MSVGGPLMAVNSPKCPSLRLLHSTTVPATREDAWALLNEFTKSPQLIKHGLGVESAMRAYASKYSGDPETWGVVGLLHDYDYERFPEVGAHAIKGSEILKQPGWPDRPHPDLPRKRGREYPVKSSARPASAGPDRLRSASPDRG